VSRTALLVSGNPQPRVDPPNLSRVPLVPFLHVQLRELADSPAGK
jgi:hypothetical protein